MSQIQATSEIRVFHRASCEHKNVRYALLCTLGISSKWCSSAVRLQQMILFDLIKRNAVGQNHVSSATLKTHTPRTSDHSKDAERGAGSLFKNDGSQLFNPGRIVSTAARQTSVTKVADRTRHQIRIRRVLTGAVASSSSPFQLFMVFSNLVPASLTSIVQQI
jgi:hypothetical protein